MSLATLFRGHQMTDFEHVQQGLLPDGFAVFIPSTALGDDLDHFLADLYGTHVLFEAHTVGDQFKERRMLVLLKVGFKTFVHGLGKTRIFILSLIGDGLIFIDLYGIGRHYYSGD